MSHSVGLGPDKDDHILKISFTIRIIWRQLDVAASGLLIQYYLDATVLICHSEMISGPVYALFAGFLGAAASLSAKLSLGADYLRDMCETGISGWTQTPGDTAACDWVRRTRHLYYILTWVSVMNTVMNWFQPQWNQLFDARIWSIYSNYIWFSKKPLNKTINC